MINPTELRIGNLVRWNPRLRDPHTTLPAMTIRVTGILPGSILYATQNLQHRVEPFEDDLEEKDHKTHSLQEIEPVHLDEESLADTALFPVGAPVYHDNHTLILADAPEGYFLEIDNQRVPACLTTFHQLQNGYFFITGHELETGS